TTISVPTTIATARHSAYARSHPHQQHPRHLPQTSARHISSGDLAISAYAISEFFIFIKSLAAVRDLQGKRLRAYHIRNSAIDLLLISISRRVKSHHLMLPLSEISIVIL
ncbi:hypothetical protein A2U01_0052151, partial [Trifolium medium]|nr:hypothetical protein [Trifolium medium]